MTKRLPFHLIYLLQMRSFVRFSAAEVLSPLIRRVLPRLNPLFLVLRGLLFISRAPPISDTIERAISAKPNLGLPRKKWKRVAIQSGKLRKRKGRSPSPIRGPFFSDSGFGVSVLSRGNCDFRGQQFVEDGLLQTRRTRELIGEGIRVYRGSYAR